MRSKKEQKLSWAINDDRKTLFWPSKGIFWSQKAHIGIQKGYIHCWVIINDRLTQSGPKVSISQILGPSMGPVGTNSVIMGSKKEQKLCWKINEVKKTYI